MFTVALQSSLFTQANGERSPLLIALVAVLLVFALNMLGRAVRPIKDVLIPLAAAGLAVIAVAAALILVLAAAVAH